MLNAGVTTNIIEFLEIYLTKKNATLDTGNKRAFVKLPLSIS